MATNAYAEIDFDTAKKTSLPSFEVHVVARATAVAGQKRSLHMDAEL
jgi:hypothetical protein